MILEFLFHGLSIKKKLFMPFFYHCYHHHYYYPGPLLTKKAYVD